MKLKLLTDTKNPLSEMINSSSSKALYSPSSKRTDPSSRSSCVAYYVSLSKNANQPKTKIPNKKYSQLN